MSTLAAAIPRARDQSALREDPLAFLGRARAAHGDAVVIAESGPIFSRAQDAVGAVALFGEKYNRAVLSDIETFGMPVSVGKRYALPAPLDALNFGLFSMRGAEHRSRQRVLSRVLNPRQIEQQHASIARGLQAFASEWQIGAEFELLTEMRRLALHVSSRLLFGDDEDNVCRIGGLVQKYFHARREYASPAGNADARAELIALGQALDGELRQHVGRSQDGPASESAGLVGKLAALPCTSGERLGQDELVGHANVLFMSSSEPVAVALSWTLLILSQLPRLRAELRHEIAESLASDASASSFVAPRLPLVGAVVAEALRLLPPNALMVRLTTAAVAMDELELPARCEVVLCPFLTHRDAVRFPHPARFLPERWVTLKPTPFEYLPFGAGGRYCMGRHVAVHVLKAALSFLLCRFDPILVYDQDVDWRLHVNLTPRNDVPMKLGDPSRRHPQRAGKLRGPVAALLELSS